MYCSRPFLFKLQTYSTASVGHLPKHTRSDSFRYRNTDGARPEKLFNLYVIVIVN